MNIFKKKILKQGLKTGKMMDNNKNNKDVMYIFVIIFKFIYIYIYIYNENYSADRTSRLNSNSNQVHSNTHHSSAVIHPRAVTVPLLPGPLRPASDSTTSRRRKVGSESAAQTQ
jgi:hypothetical protein